ncbi:MAG: hypothetical protein MZV49_17460 [Rhodopseudomonas palustris]|nr:hypothetical protein [Rhodopseudomonas palustris]
MPRVAAMRGRVLMAELFESGRLIDLILIVVVIEAVFLIGTWHYAKRGVRPGDFLPNLISWGADAAGAAADFGRRWLACAHALPVGGRFGPSLRHRPTAGRSWRRPAFRSTKSVETYLKVAM